MHKGKLTNVNPPRITTEPSLAAFPIISRINRQVRQAKQTLKNIQIHFIFPFRETPFRTGSPERKMLHGKGNRYNWHTK